MVSTTLLLTLVIGGAQAAPFSWSWKQVISPGAANPPAAIPPAGNPMASFAAGPGGAPAPRLSGAPRASPSARLSAAPAPRISQAPALGGAPRASSAPRLSAAPGAPAATPAPRAPPAPLASQAPRASPGFGAQPAPRASQGLAGGAAPPPRASAISVVPGSGGAPGAPAAVPGRSVLKSRLGRIISAPFGHRKNKARSESGERVNIAASGVAITVAPRASGAPGALGAPGAAGAAPRPAPVASNALPNGPRASNVLPGTAPQGAPLPGAPRAAGGAGGSLANLPPPNPVGVQSDGETLTNKNSINKVAEDSIQMLPAPWSNANLRTPKAEKVTSMRNSKKLNGNALSEKLSNTNATLKAEVQKKASTSNGQFFEFPPAPTSSEKLDTPKNEVSEQKAASGPVYDHLNLRNGRQNSTTSDGNQDGNVEQSSTKIITDGGKKNSTMKYQIGYITRKLRI